MVHASIVRRGTIEATQTWELALGLGRFRKFVEHTARECGHVRLLGVARPGDVQHLDAVCVEEGAQAARRGLPLAFTGQVKAGLLVTSSKLGSAP